MGGGRNHISSIILIIPPTTYLSCLVSSQLYSHPCRATDVVVGEFHFSLRNSEGQAKKVLRPQSSIYVPVGLPRQSNPPPGPPQRGGNGREKPRGVIRRRCFAAFEIHSHFTGSTHETVITHRGGVGWAH